jgi:hypothetical protein
MSSEPTRMPFLLQLSSVLSCVLLIPANIRISLRRPEHHSTTMVSLHNLPNLSPDHLRSIYLTELHEPMLREV